MRRVGPRLDGQITSNGERGVQSLLLDQGAFAQNLSERKSQPLLSSAQAICECVKDGRDVISRSGAVLVGGEACSQLIGRNFFRLSRFAELLVGWHG